MNAAACLTLAGFYFAVWCKQRQRPMYLLFSCSAIAAAAISAFELWMLNTAITDIRRFSWGGQMVSIPVGASNPWGLLSTISLLLLLIFSVDATITVWRRGD
jgi:hypothetical protein